MNDKTKHRIVGIVVIAAFLVVLVPALMKNDSNEIKEPKYAPDERPVTAMVEPVSSASVEAETYQTGGDVAQVSLDQTSNSQDTTQPFAESDGQQAIQEENVTSHGNGAMDSIEAIESSTASVATPAPAKSATVASDMPVQKSTVKPQTPPPVQAKPKAVVTLPKPKPVVVQQPVLATAQPKPVVKSVGQLTNVCFQLGTFSNQNNASLLVQKLKAKGFTTVKTTAVSLPSGQKVQRVSYCKAMAKADIAQTRAKLALIVGSSPLITR